MADIKWIKITTDVFDDEKILLIESLPDAYAIIVVWFKLLCLAGKQNNSGVFLMGQIAYTDKMLATIFRMKESIVTMALNTFEEFGMIEIIDGVITIPNWEKHQNIDSLEKIKEQTRLRVAKHREKQKALCDSNVTSNVTVTDGNATDKNRIDKEEEKNIYKSIVDYLNEKAGTNYRATTNKTQTCIHARFAEGFTIDDFKTVIDKKCADWIDDAKMAQYLRPETLFGTKFESYLNAKVTNNKPVNTGIPTGSNQSDLDDLF